MSEDYNFWYERAKKDFDTAKYNIDGKKLDAGIFFLQQSVEKALKSLYIKRFDKLFKTHDLVALARKLKAPDEILVFCKKLNPAYQYTRYPDIIEVLDLDSKAEEFISYVMEVLEWVKKNL
mgnify:CR=1 FL=1